MLNVENIKDIVDYLNYLFIGTIITTIDKVYVNYNYSCAILTNQPVIEVDENTSTDTHNIVVQIDMENIQKYFQVSVFAISNTLGVAYEDFLVILSLLHEYGHYICDRELNNKELMDAFILYTVQCRNIDINNRIERQRVYLSTVTDEINAEKFAYENIIKVIKGLKKNRII